MREFKVLPTDERFQNLTEEQIDFIILKMEQDNKRRAGHNSDAYYSDDDFEITGDDEAVYEKEDLEHITKQMEEQSGEYVSKVVSENLKRLREGMKGKKAYDEELDKTISGKIEALKDLHKQREELPHSEDDEWI